MERARRRKEAEGCKDISKKRTMSSLGGAQITSQRKFRLGDEVKRARTGMDFEMNNRELWYWGNMDVGVSFDMLIVTTNSQLSVPSTSAKRNDSSWQRGNIFTSSPQMQAFIFLNHQKSNYSPGWSHFWIVGLPKHACTHVHPTHADTHVHAHK